MTRSQSTYLGVGVPLGAPATVDVGKVCGRCRREKASGDSRLYVSSACTRARAGLPAGIACLCLRRCVSGSVVQLPCAWATRSAPFTVVCCRQLSSLACALCLSPSQAPSGCGSGGRRAAAKKRAALVDVTNAANAGARAAASRAKVRAFKQTAARLDAHARPLRASPRRTPPANAGAAATRRGTLPSARVRTAASASLSAPLPTRVAPLHPRNRHRPSAASRTTHRRQLDHASTAPLCPTTVPVVTPDATSYRRLNPLSVLSAGCIGRGGLA